VRGWREDVVGGEEKERREKREGETVLQK